MAVLPHEGTYPIMYGSWPIPVGSGHRTGYISRPDEEGRFPVVFVLPSLEGVTGFEKDLCRRLARRGFAGPHHYVHRLYGSAMQVARLFPGCRLSRILSRSR
ncbi:MAG: dienelactone hydrolase family protein, partial [Actinobacteria bacterium]|nr:dienelactone hydrolase family protein [Actinomycetota bacterium]